MISCCSFHGPWSVKMRRVREQKGGGSGGSSSLSSDESQRSMRTLLVCASTYIVSSSTGVSRRASRLNEMPLACKSAPDAPERAAILSLIGCKSTLAPTAPRWLAPAAGRLRPCVLPPLCRPTMVLASLLSLFTKCRCRALCCDSITATQPCLRSAQPRHSCAACCRQR